MKELRKDELQIQIYEDRPALGRAAADQIAKQINSLLSKQESVRIIFASAPSQNEFLAEIATKDIDWSRIEAFHMDEYIGLDDDAPQGFANFLREKLFDKVKAGKVHYIAGNTGKPEEECERYAGLLTSQPIDIIILGIGENTHLAFNDPHVADFNDPKIVKIVDLDEKNRRQQVDPNDKNCFTSLDLVPTHAITITMPALITPRFAYAIVPGKFKTDAIFHTVNSPVSENYPSTILRRKQGAILFIDEDSASKLDY